MQLHNISPIHKSKKKKRIGRGGKSGTYSGRGQKGQKSRAGARFEPIIRGLIKKYPKLRGYRFKSKAKILKSKITILSLDVLETKFKSGDKVNSQTLLEKKIICRMKGKIPAVKILGRGELTKTLIIQNCDISKSAREKVEKAGGTIKIRN